MKVRCSERSPRLFGESTRSSSFCSKTSHRNARTVKSAKSKMGSHCQPRGRGSGAAVLRHSDASPMSAPPPSASAAIAASSPPCEKPSAMPSSTELATA